MKAIIKRKYKILDGTVKIGILLCVIAIFSGTLSGCEKKKTYIEDTSILCGVYRAEEGEYARGIGPELRLEPDGKGSFHVHSASSYIASGSYEASDGKIILTDEFSDEPLDRYVFEIDGNKLIFLGDESVEVWDYGPGTVEDGMVFVYDDELTEWYMGDGK